MNNDIEIRPLETHADLLACVALQRETWGARFTEVVPPSLLLACQKVGGISAGAFTATGELVGFVFGMSGVENGKLVHWSDMLAVKANMRDRRLGWRLKMHQRTMLIARGVRTIYWSYDPLEARNAHLNFNKLGATFSDYVTDMYPGEKSDLHRGLGTDRFIVAWQIQSKRVENILAGEPPRLPPATSRSPIVTLKNHGASDIKVSELPTDRIIRVEIPANIQETKHRGHALGRRWRCFTRQVFLHYLAADYRVRNFYADAAAEQCFYLLVR